ncbi:MAG: glycosyltransferase family 4 protein [Melioribacter sp.]|nr:glycosyltransferase family 4 protein [Melioribacter sp.]
MKIGIDCRVLNRGITGTGRYLKNLLSILPQIDKSNKYYLFSVKELDVDKTYFTVITKNFKVPYKIFSPFWMNYFIPSLLNKYDIDVFVSPNIILPIKKKTNIKYVTVIHDVIPFIYKEYYPLYYRAYLSFFVPLAIRVADKILTVSEHSKKDIISLFNISEEKVEVTYNFASENFSYLKEENPLLQSVKLPEKYLLYVGAIEKRKNVAGLIKIVDNLWGLGYKLPLVIVGKPNYGYKDLMNEISKRTEKIIFVNNLNDGELNIIYNKAFLFLFPSYYEGFGIPVLEAMKCGVPVICSNTSSLPEIVEDTGLTHHPDDIEGFVNDIISLINDKAKYNSLKMAVLRQSEKFNNYNVAIKFVSIINDLKK